MDKIPKALPPLTPAKKAAGTETKLQGSIDTASDTPPMPSKQPRKITEPGYKVPIFHGNPTKAFISNNTEGNKLKEKLETMIKKLAQNSIEVHSGSVGELYDIIQHAILEFKTGVITKDEFCKPMVESSFYKKLKLTIAEITIEIIRARGYKEGIRITNETFQTFGEPLSYFKIKENPKNNKTFTLGYQKPNLI